MAATWLPFTYALAAALVAAVAIAVPAADRRRLLWRHAALYLATPALLLLALYARPLENGTAGLLYVALAGAIAGHALLAVWSALAALSDRRVAALLGLTMLATALAIVPYHRAVQPTESDEPHYLIVMQSLVLDGDLELRNDYAGERYLEFYPVILDDIHGVRVGDAIYSVRDLGLVALGSLPFALGGRGGVLVLVCLAGALLVWQLFLLLRDLGFDRQIAFLATALAGFSHPLFTYTRQVYPELLAALALVIAARALARGRGTTVPELAIASLCVGALPWLTTRAWFAAVGVGLVIAYRAFRPFSPARVLAGALPFAALLALLCFVNWRTFGLFMPAAGYYLIKDNQEVLAFAPHTGAAGLFFDRVFGLIPRTPLYLLAFLGLVPLLRRASSRPAVIPLGLAWLLSFIYLADIAYWYADGSPPSRYLVASLPFLVAAFAAGLEVVRAVSWRPALVPGVAFLAWWSALVTLVLAAQPNLAYELASRIRASGGHGQLWEFVGRVVRPDPGALFPSLVRVDGASAALAVAWVLVAAMLVVAGLRGPQASAARSAASASAGAGRP